MEGYKIYYLTASPDGWTDGTGLAQGASPITVPLGVLGTATTPSFQLSGLTDGESYHFSVTAYNENGHESDFSNLVRYDVPVSVTYSLTASASGSGSISPAGTVSVSEASSQTFIITADQDHHIEDVVIDDDSMGAISSYTFENIQASHSIQALFAADNYPDGTSDTENDSSNLVSSDLPVSVTYSLTASASGSGSISPAGTVSVSEASSQTFIITADQDHHIEDVVIDGDSMGAISSYTFENIQASHSIQALFAANIYSVSTSATESSSIIPTLSFETDFFFEVGEITANNNWKQVTYSRPFENPVVVATAMSNNDDEPAVVRIDNITDTGFEISVQEWDYLDDDHLDETIGYIVMEAGSYTLSDGSTVEAGTFTAYGTSTFTTVYLTGVFTQVPVLVSSVISYNGPDAVAIRLQNITATRFEARIQQQQANRKSHPIETVSYIAWEPCRTRLDDLSIVVDRTDDLMTDDFKAITFKTIFPMPPVFVATIQTTDGSDTAALRWEERSTSDIQVKVEEEQSWDLETDHTHEVVGYFTFAQVTADSTY